MITLANLNAFDSVRFLPRVNGAMNKHESAKCMSNLCK